MFKVSKKNFTAFILRIAKYTPFVFPDGVVFFSKDSGAGRDVPYSSKKDKKIKRISYFSGDFKWKAITLSSIVTKKEVSILEKNLDNLEFHSFLREHAKLSKTSIEDHGCFNYGIGSFNINRQANYDALGSLFVKNDLFSGVYVSLFKSPSGLFVLTYYFFMTDKATDLIKSVDVSDLVCFREFVGFNIYKRKNMALRTVDRKIQAAYRIELNNMKVINEAKSIVGKLGDKLGLVPTEFVIGSEYYKDQEEPYFNDAYISESFSGEEIYYISSSRHDELNYSDDPSEHYFRTPSFRKQIFDFSYLLCKKNNQFEQFDNFQKRYYQCYEDHLVFVPLYILHKEISRIIETISNVISSERIKDLAKHHDIVYDCLSQTETFKKWIGEIEADYKFHADEKYHRVLGAFIKRQKARVGDLYTSTKTFYSLSENRVQVENIRYSKRNSKFILWLVIIQIILASITIDLYKKAQWYSPIVNFILSN